MLFGVWGMKMDVFYIHGYYFILLIVLAYIFILNIYKRLTFKRSWMSWLVLAVSLYPVFIFLSALFVCVYLSIQNSGAGFSDFISDFKRIFVDALLIGVLMIVFSPITFVIMLSHWIVTRIYRKGIENPLQWELVLKARHIKFALHIGMKSFFINAVLTMLLGAMLWAVVYFKYFRFSEVSTYTRSNGATFALLKDKWISGDITYSICRCFDEAYFLLKLNDRVVYKFYREVQECPNYFKIVKIDSDSIIIESNGCFFV